MVGIIMKELYIRLITEGDKRSDQQLIMSARGFSVKHRVKYFVESSGPMSRYIETVLSKYPCVCIHTYALKRTDTHYRKHNHLLAHKSQSKT